MMKIYRLTADVIPDKISEFHAAASYDKKYLYGGEHTVGDGMYFSFNKDICEIYLLARNPSKFAIIGEFYVKGEYRVYDNIQPDGKDPEMEKLENLLEQVVLKAEKNHKQQYGENTISTEDLMIMKPYEINEYFDKKFEKLKNKKKVIGSNDDFLDDESAHLGILFNKIKKKMKELRNNYQISIFNYEEVCTHSPEVVFELQSFDIYFLTEEAAKNFWEKAKVGELANQIVRNIPAANASQVSKILMS